jgi:hypothetical protein
MTPTCVPEPEGVFEAFVRMVPAQEKWHRTMRHLSAFTAAERHLLMHRIRRLAPPAALRAIRAGARCLEAGQVLRSHVFRQAQHEVSVSREFPVCRIGETGGNRGQTTVSIDLLSEDVT